MIVKITILRLLCSSDDKEKIGVARPEGPPLRGFRYPELQSFRFGGTLLSCSALCSAQLSEHTSKIMLSKFVRLCEGNSKNLL